MKIWVENCIFLCFIFRARRGKRILTPFEGAYIKRRMAEFVPSRHEMSRHIDVKEPDYLL